MEPKRKQKVTFRSFGSIEASELEYAIIIAFFPEAQEMTIKDIQDKVDYSYERINSGLKSLTEKKIISEKNIGKTLVYKLDFHSLYSLLGYSHYTLQRVIEFIRKHRALYDAIKKIESNPYVWAVMLFGSYSKGTETKGSDVDIICISQKKEETERFVRSLKHEYGLEFSPVVFEYHKFRDVKDDNPELLNDLKLHGIPFKGSDYFYAFIYK